MKKLAGLCFVLSLLLAACGGTAPETTGSEEPVEEVAQVAESEDVTGAAESVEESSADDKGSDAVEEAAAATATQPAQTEDTPATPTQAAEPAPAESDQPASQASTAGCNVAPLNINKNPGITDVAATDWQHGGGLEARIQLVEYGDFQ